MNDTHKLISFAMHGRSQAHDIKGEGCVEYGQQLEIEKDLEKLQEKLSRRIQRLMNSRNT